MMNLAGLGEHDDDAAAGIREVRRYSHFEIVLAADGSLDELGRGAMGTTYRALDTRLQSLVALKVISRDIAESAALRARFLREARAAARLRHPNVASVFHYGEQDGECFYVMELVEGETLEARVRREGPLSAASVLGICVQVARALSAAEAQGLVHRDIKPSNLMVSTHHGESGEPDALIVKIIDFGLAKAIHAEPLQGANHTRDHFVGTPAFASPEQFAKPADQPIDTRSDIYSLGVTIWYLLCGRAPYVGRTLEEIQARQGKFPFEQLVDTRVPGCVATLLRSMLAVDPSARPQSARDLLVALRRCQEQSAVRRVRRSWLAALLGLIVILAASAGAWWHHGTVSSPALADKSIAVLPFENLSPDKADAFFTRGVQAEISENLGRISDLKVIDLSSTDFYLPGKRNLAQIGRELGVWHLLEGSLRREDGQVHLKIRLVDVRDSAHGWTQQYDRLLTDVFAVQGEITHAVADRLGATLSAREKAAVDEPPTHDLAAYDLYLRADAGNCVEKGIAALSRYHRETEIPLLGAAIARDPNFAFAYCRLANSYDWLQRFEATVPAEERMVDYRGRAEAALACARRLRPESGEMHLAQAIHFLNGNRDNEQARIEAVLARDTLPNSTAVEAVSGEIARAQNRWEEALRCAERSLALDPRNNNLRFELAFVHYQMYHYDEFDDLMDRVVAASEPAGAVTIRLFRALGALEARADPAPIRVVLAGLTPEEAQRRDGVRDKYRLLLALYARNADEISSILTAYAQPRFMYNGVPYPREWFEAFAARLRQDSAGAQAAFRAARVEVYRALQTNPFDGRLWGLLGMIDAGLGNKEDAMREVRRGGELTPLEQSSDEAPIVAAELAVVYAWTNQPDLACAVLEEWVGRPSDSHLPLRLSYGNLRLHPCWDPLRGNPRFEALVKKFSPDQER